MDKHFEVIIRQMMRKVQIIDFLGDTKFFGKGKLVHQMRFQRRK